MRAPSRHCIEANEPDMNSQWLLQTSPLHWHELYLAAVFESDRSRVPARLMEAELAIAARARELFHAPSNGNIERQALDSCLQALHMLRSCAKTSRTHGPLLSNDGTARVGSKGHPQWTVGSVV